MKRCGWGAVTETWADHGCSNMAVILTNKKRHLQLSDMLGSRCVCVCVVCVRACDLDITGQTLSQSYLNESLIKSSESEMKWLVSDHGYFDHLFIVSMIFQAKIVQNIKHDHHGQVPDEMSSCFSLFDIIVNWISFGSELVLGSFPRSLWSCDFSYEPEISKKNVTRMYKHLSKTYSY